MATDGLQGQSEFDNEVAVCDGSNSATWTQAVQLLSGMLCISCVSCVEDVTHQVQQLANHTIHQATSHWVMGFTLPLALAGAVAHQSWPSCASAGSVPQQRPTAALPVVRVSAGTQDRDSNISACSVTFSVHMQYLQCSPADKVLAALAPQSICMYIRQHARV